MASLIWIDTKGNRHESDEYNDIESFRSYIKENTNNIKVVELLDCDPLVCLYDFSTQSGLFGDCINLEEVKEVIGTSEVEDMSSMFANCVNLESVPYFDTSSAKYMGDMFTYCMRLNSVPLFDTSSVIYIGGMFEDCSSLKSYILPCNEYSTRSSVVKSYEDFKKSEKMLKKLNEHLEGQ